MHREELKHLLAALTRPNRLAMEISLATGLRLSDVLGIRAADVRGGTAFSIRELKTGKRRTIRLCDELAKRCLREAGKVFVFEHRNDWRRHRTRQAVFKDLKRIARAFRCKPNVAPHTARKVWAVDEYHKHKDLKRVQKLLNHSGEAVTMIYAMADQLTARKHPTSGR